MSVYSSLSNCSNAIKYGVWFSVSDGTSVMFWTDKCWLTVNKVCKVFDMEEWNDKA
jgi:hypothetical protein